jgi:hypothetical protein
VWSCDAIYRETRDKVTRYRQMGISGVEMVLTFILLLFRLPATHVGLLKLPVHVYLRLVYLPPMFELSHCTSWLFLLSASLISNSLKLFFFSFHLFLHSSPIHDGQMGKWGKLNFLVTRRRRTRPMAVK